MTAVGRDIAHDSAATHVSGESVFLDDLPPLAGELIAGIVPSPVACGVLKSIDVSAALAVPGVHAVLLAKHVPGHNRFGPVVKDEDLIVEREITFLGQPLAILAADSQAALDAGRAAIVYEIEKLEPVLEIEHAIERDQFFGTPLHMARGDLDAGFAAADHTLSGEVRIGGQEHFYLESQIAIAVPGERKQMVIHSSTQHPSECQMLAAEVLGVPFNHVICICRRMGGGFGGKETQAAQPAMFAALLAAKTRRPVRFVYSKDDDMRYTGKRHPFLSRYRVGFTNDGRITALEVELFSNGGCSTDLSFAVLERAMLHTDNAYYLPAVKITGRVCRTNLPSNTAFRGFGGPQGVASTEHILSQVAAACRMDCLDVRRVNLYRAGQATTHYGQLVDNNVLPRLFDELEAESEYRARRREVEVFNATSRTHARGLAISPVKFGISFTRKTMNQANALVNIYEDGSVLVSTGATEMGQGVNTRIAQIVADELGIGFDRVIVGVTSTEKNNNTSPTAASAGTDLNGAAAAIACEKLRERLAVVAADMLGVEASSMRFEVDEAFDAGNPSKRLSFPAVVCEAFERRVSLGERGHYATPGVDFNRATGQGTPFLYFTNGISCSEVLVDRFTGEATLTRVDLIMDAGKPLNPGIDRGQVIGGFVQGMGWCTNECLVYGPTGALLSYSPTTYKIPNISDVPAAMNVRFLDNPDSAVSLRRSKAVGEPPLLLGLSVWLAIQDAVRAVAGSAAAIELPATGEAILRAMSRQRPVRAATTAATV